MYKQSISLLSALLMATPAIADPAQDTAALFAPWAGGQGPGCAVSVVRDGQVVFKDAYGMAIIEAKVPNTTDTTFQMASVSKQMTAFAVHMLAAEGKLSLQDDVRKYVPELHAFAKPITIDHLLHHTSGLRDEWILMLQGRRQEDTITQHDVLRTLFAQRELNFEPGSRFAYSNSNYTLLALVVERASGQSFPDFMKTKIFTPLAMTSTYVKHDVRPVRVNPAFGYGQGPNGPESRIFPFTAYGAGNVYSTAEDMARWTINLVDPKVGSAQMVEGMQRSVRGPEAPSRYGSGLEVGQYRGETTLRHGGISPGAATHMMAIPSKGFGVTVMCNAETNDTGRFAERIADIHLGSALAAPVAPAEFELSEIELQRFAGRFREPGGQVFGLTVKDGNLVIGQDKLTPISPNAFRLGDAPVHFSFTGGDANGAAVMHIHDPDQDRITARFDPPVVADLSPETMGDYVGDYYSPELSAIVKVETRGKEMWITGAAFEVPLHQPSAGERGPDGFYTPSTIGAVEFFRDSTGKVIGLSQSNGRVIAVRFLKVDLPTL